MTTNKCPFCGAPENWRKAPQSQKPQSPAWGPWEKREYSTLGIADVSAIPAGVEYERRRPARDPTLESDVLTPVLQTLVTGAVGAAMTGAVAGLAEWTKPFLWAAVGGASTLSVAWLALLTDHRALLWEVEQVTGTDLDQDGLVGEPTTPTPRLTRVEVTEHEQGNTRMRYVDVPLSDRELEQVAHLVLTRHESFSQRGLDSILSQDQYRELYSTLLDGGLLRYKGSGPRSGVELTGPGRSFLEQYLTEIR